MVDNVIPLRPAKLTTAALVLEDAAKADLEHIMIVGIKKNGENYIELSGNSTLMHDTWMLKCADRV